MQYAFEQYRDSADYIRSRIGDFTPETAMILGSGLGYLGDEVRDAAAVSYGDIPNFKVSTAPGHKGRLMFGRRRRTAAEDRLPEEQVRIAWQVCSLLLDYPSPTLVAQLDLARRAAGELPAYLAEPVNKEQMRNQRLSANPVPDYLPVSGRHNNWGFNPEEQRTQTYLGMAMASLRR